MHLFHFKIKAFFCKVYIQHTVAGLDFLLLEAFAPAIGKLALEIILQILHFRSGERFLQHDRGAAHKFITPDFHRRNGTERTFALTLGFRSSSK